MGEIRIWNSKRRGRKKESVTRKEKGECLKGIEEEKKRKYK